MNVKVVQEILGHADISTTLDIYADVTEDTKVKTFRELENTFKSIGICGTPIWHQLYANLHGLYVDLWRIA